MQRFNFKGVPVELKGCNWNMLLGEIKLLQILFSFWIRPAVDPHSGSEIEYSVHMEIFIFDKTSLFLIRFW